MPRALRLEFEGAVYHVLARGQRGDPIVNDDTDRRQWLETLGETVTRAGWKLLAFVLMNNHFHLLIETPQRTLVSGMKWLQGTYATRFRLRHGLVGSVFAGRYKALLIERDDRYLGTVLDYIHLNGWRARQATLDRGLDQSRWCSLHWYALDPKRRPAWLAAAEGLRWHGLTDTAANRRVFIDRIEMRARCGTRRTDSQSEERLGWSAALRRGWCFGSASFRENLLSRAKDLLRSGKDVSYIDCRVRRDVGEAEAIALLNAACRLWKWSDEELFRRRKGDAQKVTLARFILQRTGVPLSWIQQHLHTGAPAATSRLLSHRHELACSSGQRSRWLADLNEMSK